jgi:hypothetical protein
MNFKFCGEYVIMDVLPVGDKGAAMGINQTNGSFATWETAGGEYKEPHYFTDIDEATEDLCLRTLRELRLKKQLQKTEKERRR